MDIIIKPILRFYASSEKVDLYDAICRSRKVSHFLALYTQKQLCGCLYLFPHPQYLAAYCLLTDVNYVSVSFQSAIETILETRFPKLRIFLETKAYPLVMQDIE